jgi:hypothetical protein
MSPGALTGTANAHIVRFLDGVNCRLVVRDTGTVSTWAVYKRSAAAVYTQLGSNFINTGINITAPVAFDIHVVYGTTGSVTIYIAGAQVFTFSGDTTTDGATTLSSVEIAGIAASSNNVIWSEVIVMDVDTRPMGLWLMNSVTAGNAQTFTGTATNVNKAVISDATFISAASAGLIQEYRSGGIALPAGSFTVATVKINSRAQIGASGPQHLQYVTRVGTTDYPAGSWSPVVGSFGNDVQNYMVPINPGTSVAWTTADLTATTFNYGVESAA